MTATDMHTFIEDIRTLTVPDANAAWHPAALVTINELLRDMHIAADEGDGATVARLARYIQEKIAQETAYGKI